MKTLAENHKRSDITATYSCLRSLMKAPCRLPKPLILCDPLQNVHEYLVLQRCSNVILCWQNIMQLVYLQITIMLLLAYASTC